MKVILITLGILILFSLFFTGTMFLAGAAGTDMEPALRASMAMLFSLTGFSGYILFLEHAL